MSDGSRYVQKGIDWHSEPVRRPHRATGKPPGPRRRATDADVITIRRDYQLRRRAEGMLREARYILESTPTCEDHGKRIGMAGSNVRQIARGKSYREVKS